MIDIPQSLSKISKIEAEVLDIDPNSTELTATQLEKLVEFRTMTAMYIENQIEDLEERDSSNGRNDSASRVAEVKIFLSENESSKDTSIKTIRDEVSTVVNAEAKISSTNISSENAVEKVRNPVDIQAVAKATEKATSSLLNSAGSTSATNNSVYEAALLRTARKSEIEREIAALEYQITVQHRLTSVDDAKTYVRSQYPALFTELEELRCTENSLEKNLETREIKDACQRAKNELELSKEKYRALVARRKASKTASKTET